MRKELEPKKEQIMKRDKDKKLNYKLQRITNSNSRPRDLLKKKEWKTNSKSKWLRSLLKMNVWSK
jgi:hypothetical protein